MLALRRRTGSRRTFDNLPVSVRMNRLKRLSDCISLCSVHPMHTLPRSSGKKISVVSGIIEKLKRFLDWLGACGLRVIDAFPRFDNLSTSDVMAKLKKLLDHIVRFLCMGPVWYYAEGVHPYGNVEDQLYGVTRHVNDSNVTLVSITSEEIRRREAAQEMYIHIPLCIF